MSKSKPPYPPELRRQILDLLKAGRTAEELARDYEPTATTIRNWEKEDAIDSGRRADGLTTEERAEIARLRREVRPLREEGEDPEKKKAQMRAVDPEVRAELAATKDRVKKLEKDREVETFVAGAKKRLETQGFEISEETEKDLFDSYRGSKDEGDRFVATYTRIAQKDPAKNLADAVGAAGRTDAAEVAKFAAEGTEKLEAARKFSALYDEGVARGLVNPKERSREAFIRSQFRAEQARSQEARPMAPAANTFATIRMARDRLALRVRNAETIFAGAFVALAGPSHADACHAMNYVADTANIIPVGSRAPSVRDPRRTAGQDPAGTSGGGRIGC